MNNNMPNQFTGRQRPTNPNVIGRQTKVPVNSALYNNFEKKSLYKKPMTIRERKKYEAHKKLMELLKKVTCAFITSAVVTVCAVSMANTINREKEFNDLYHDATSIVHENTHRTEDREHYWIDYYKVAEGLSTLDGDLNVNLYGVYQSVGWDNESTIDQMNTIMRYCHKLNITDYEDFEDLCRQNGFCNNEGKIDLRKYQDAMRDYLDKIIEIQNAQEEKDSIMPPSESSTMSL